MCEGTGITPPGGLPHSLKWSPLSNYTVPDAADSGPYFEVSFCSTRWWKRLDPQKPVVIGLVWSGFLINCGAVWLINLSYLMQ